MISWVAPVNPCHPYLENAPAPSFDPHHLRISPWLWFSFKPNGIHLRWLRVDCRLDARSQWEQTHRWTKRSRG